MDCVLNCYTTCIPSLGTETWPELVWVALTSGLHSSASTVRADVLLCCWFSIMLLRPTNCVRPCPYAQSYLWIPITRRATEISIQKAGTHTYSTIHIIFTKCSWKSLQDVRGMAEAFTPISPGARANHPVETRPPYLVRAKLVLTSFIQDCRPGPRLSRPGLTKAKVIQGTVVYDASRPGNLTQMQLHEFTTYVVHPQK